jgi:hypothetical protein
MLIQTLAKRRKVNGEADQVLEEENWLNAPSYRTRLSLYPTPPTEEITLEEFEDFAIARLKGTPPTAPTHFFSKFFSAKSISLFRSTASQAYI